MPDEVIRCVNFILLLQAQNPKSVMAEVWLMEHRVCTSSRRRRVDARYKRFLKSKGKAVPKLTIKKVKTEVKEETEAPVETKPVETKVVVDDDLDDDDVSDKVNSQELESKSRRAASTFCSPSYISNTTHT